MKVDLFLAMLLVQLVFQMGQACPATKEQNENKEKEGNNSARYIVSHMKTGFGGSSNLR